MTSPDRKDVTDPAEAAWLLNRVPWRTGRKVGRTIYAQVGTEPGDSDILIGVMDHPGLAQAAVDAHNAARS